MVSTDIALRAYAARDLPTLRAIRNDHAAQSLLMGHPEARVRDDDTEGWVARRSKDGSGAFFVIARGDECIGFAQLTGRHDLDRHAHFGIALHQAARGAGIGAVAMHRLIDVARASGLRKLLCEVRSDNRAALTLYRRLGFRDVGVLLQHYDDGERRFDSVLMERSLDDGGAT